MKKSFALWLAAFALILCSCTQIDPIRIDPTLSVESISSATTTVGYILPSLPDPLPLPNSIKLEEEPHNAFTDGEDWDFTYRIIYYGIPSQIGNIVVDRSDDFFPSLEGVPGPEAEMAIVSYVKHYDIQKEDFIEAVQSMYSIQIDRGWGIYDEGSELPNPDIIYTFDNEVINAYYRRENPVVPDWLTNLQP